MSEEIPFTYTGVFATDDQVKFIQHCQSMALMAMTNPEPPGPGVPHAVPMFTTPIEAAHKAALEQGLPEFEGYYGIDLCPGEHCKEFVKPS